jgi:hypothetical protein
MTERYTNYITNECKSHAKKRQPYVDLLLAPFFESPIRPVPLIFMNHYVSGGSG